MVSRVQFGCFFFCISSLVREGCCSYPPSPTGYSIHVHTVCNPCLSAARTSLSPVIKIDMAGVQVQHEVLVRARFCTQQDSGSLHFSLVELFFYCVTVTQTHYHCLSILQRRSTSHVVFVFAQQHQNHRTSPAPDFVPRNGHRECECEKREARAQARTRTSRHRHSPPPTITSDNETPPSMSKPELSLR